MNLRANDVFNVKTELLRTNHFEQSYHKKGGLSLDDVFVFNFVHVKKVCLAAFFLLFFIL